MDSRIQTRECSGLRDRGKNANTPEKTHKGILRNTLRHFTSFPAFHSLHRPPYATSFQGPESPVRLPVKIRIKFKHTLNLSFKTNGFHFRRNTLHRQAHRLDVVRRRQASSGSDSTKAAPEEIQSRTRRDARPAGHGSPHSLHRTRHQAHRRGCRRAQRNT